MYLNKLPELATLGRISIDVGEENWSAIGLMGDGFLTLDISTADRCLAKLGCIFSESLFVAIRIKASALFDRNFFRLGF